jgi:SpoIID/LytB domain protein
MISSEPLIRVGVIEGTKEQRGEFRGEVSSSGLVNLSGPFHAEARNGSVRVRCGSTEISVEREIRCTPTGDNSFALDDVAIGIKFHWERKERQEFKGGLLIRCNADDTLTAVNEIGLEEYLRSVISSEMSAEAPIELLKAHAITSRSWLVAMIEREGRNVGVPSRRSTETESEIVRWYDREDHADFDVCADDHCQRYQGITKIISNAARRAVDETRGMFLVHENEVCDARFSKSCGGISELFENCWESRPHPYLTSISDARTEFSSISSERDARLWIESSPQAFCNTMDRNVFRQILPSFDQETVDFFRWKVSYSQLELAALLQKKSGFDFGEVKKLVPLERGPSGRIFKLKIEGTKRTLVVGKELEIRRWLSLSHLYSSAFVVDVEEVRSGIPSRFTLLGAGWGHGVGLCQIGAAVMATERFAAEDIVKHYFRGAALRKLY